MASGVRRMAGSVFGLGRIRPAPGTWGSLGAVLLAVALFGLDGGAEAWVGPLPGLLTAELVGTDPPLVVWTTFVVLGVLFVLGCRLGDSAKEDWGRSDPAPFVLDEVVGQGLALLPLLPGPLDPLGLLVAFAAFRVLDIAKPPPIRQLERRPGGVGIMADDVAAGFVAMLLVILVRSLVE